MEIVANNFMLRYFKNVSYFKLDLGLNLKGPVNVKAGAGDNSKIKIRDEFVKKYYAITGVYINKYGSIGKIKFYEDSRLNRNEFHIYKDQGIYEIEASDLDLEKSPTEYITEILMKLDEIETNSNGEHIDENIIKNVVYTNIPEELDLCLDKNLDKADYIKALVDRRRFIDNLDSHIK